MFKGAYTAIVTPFTSSGDIDKDALKRLVDTQIAAGIDGLVPTGTTGESPTLSNEEHHEVVRLVIEYADGRVPIIAGAGSNSTAEALELSRHAKADGAAATLHVAGYYNKPSAAGYLRHFLSIADDVDLPLIVYNIAPRTAKNIDNDTMLKLAEHPNIVGVKEASGDYTQRMELVLHRPDGFVMLSGDDEATFPMMALGGEGVISVTANLVPERMIAIVRKMQEGDTAGARTLHYELLPLMSALMKLDTNPIPIKAALALTGQIGEHYRLPMTPLATGARTQLQEVLTDYGLL